MARGIVHVLPSAIIGVAVSETGEGRGPLPDQRKPWSNWDFAPWLVVEPRMAPEAFMPAAYVCSATPEPRENFWTLPDAERVKTVAPSPSFSFPTTSPPRLMASGSTYVP